MTPTSFWTRVRRSQRQGERRHPWAVNALTDSSIGPSVIAKAPRTKAEEQRWSSP